MATLTIDDETLSSLTRRAHRRGMTVERLLAADAAKDDGAENGFGTSEPDRLDDWDEWLRAFAARHAPTGRPVDDSRESIYP